MLFVAFGAWSACELQRPLTDVTDNFDGVTYGKAVLIRLARLQSLFITRATRPSAT
jgi:hypothetical protein